MLRSALTAVGFLTVLQHWWYSTVRFIVYTVLYVYEHMYVCVLEYYTIHSLGPPTAVLEYILQLNACCMFPVYRSNWNSYEFHNYQLSVSPAPYMYPYPVHR